MSDTLNGVFKRPVATCLCAAALLLFQSCGSSARMVSQSGNAKQAGNRKSAPDFTLQDAEGKSLKLSDLRGKVVLLNFWATWCGPCALEIPWFVEFQQQFKNRGLEIVGVSMDEDGWTAVKPYIAQHKINYHVLLGNDSVSQLYGGVDSLPTTFIIDRDGRFAVAPHVGLAEKNEYLQDIENALNESRAADRLFVPGLLSLGAAGR